MVAGGAAAGVRKPNAGTAAPAPPAKKPNNSAPLALVVRCKSEVDEIGMGTLVGEYLEMGLNHGRKFFKRKKAASGEIDTTVFLYFWDLRDGPDFSGWWFGDKVGGAQVWSRCDSKDPLPPHSGWRIPWDADVVEDLVIERRGAAGKPLLAAKQEMAKAEIAKEEMNDLGANAELDERVQRASDRITIAEIEATQALESAHVLMEGEVDGSGLKLVEELLQAQQASLSESHQALATDIIEARKEAPATVPHLTKLTPRLRSVQASLAQEMSQAKELFNQKQHEAAEANKRAKDHERLLVTEQQDAKKLEEALPEAMEIVTKAEESIDPVVAAASPLATEFAEELTESVLAAIKETEAAAATAKLAIQAARQEVSGRMAVARQFAPEAQKVALSEYSSLNDKLNEAQKKLNPYMRIRKEYEQKLEAKKVMAEVANKLGTVEVEVEKLRGLFVGDATPSEADVETAETSLLPVTNNLESAMKFVTQRIQSVQGPLKEDLAQMQERGTESKKKLDKFREDLIVKKEEVQQQLVLQHSLDKTLKAEELLDKTTLAETPFLKGIELPPGSIATEAIAECEEVGKAAELAADQATSYLKTQLADINRFPEERRMAITAELVQLQNRANVVAQKVQTFRRDTAQRKTSLLLQEAMQKVAEAESKVRQVVEAADPLGADKVEETAIDKVREATEKTLELEKAAALACADARKELSAKQKDEQSKEASYVAELAKLQARLDAAGKELVKGRKSALSGEKLWKSKMLLIEKEEELKRVEGDIEKVEIATTPLGDERPSDEAIAEIDVAVNAAQTALSELVNSIESTLATAQGSLKHALVRLVARTKKAQGTLDEVKSTTKGQRERVKCDQLVKAARGKLQKVDEAFEQVAQAEAPYLKGVDITDVEEALRAVAESEAAIVAVQHAISEARTFLTSRSLEIRSFLDEVSKVGLGQIGELSKKNEDAAEKLINFKKETEGRKRIAQQLEAIAKVTAAEEAVQKTILAAAPLAAQDVDEVPPDVAKEICGKLAETEQLAQDKLDDARKFLAEVQRRHGDSTELSKLAQRLNEVQVDMAKARATANVHEQKFLAKMVLEEANELVQALEGELEKATDAAAPLVVEGGKTFVVASMAKVILEALSDHVSQRGETKESLFAQMQSDPSNGKVNEKDFVAFLEKIPDMCNRPDLAFSAEQRSAVFQHLDSDGDGAISQPDFLDMFHERYTCIRGISVTEDFDLSSGSTVDKLEVNDVVEATGEPRNNETLGVMRIPVRVLRDGTSGWVTLQGNQGPPHLELFTEYASFMRGLDQTLGGVHSAATKATAYISTKGAELRECRVGALADAKSELAKLRPRVSVAQTKVETLKQRIEEGKREHQKREELEKQQQAEKKERKATAKILMAVTEKVDAAQASLERLQDAAGPLASIKNESDLNLVEAPMSVRKASDQTGEVVSAAVATATESLKAYAGKLAKATKGPWLEAKQEMAKLQEKVDAIRNKSLALVAQVSTACDSIGAVKLEEVTVALRASVHSRGITNEKLFDELAGDGGEHIQEMRFGKYLDTLPNLTISDEQKQLFYQQVGTGDITRRTFLTMLDRYCRCVKEIAITSEFDIKASTTLRKLEPGEVVEVIEGPQIDESLGVTRVRAKAMSDGKSGWVTLKGNQGTPYLRNSSKPYYVAAEPVVIQDEFDVEEAKDLRRLKSCEVVEVVEGPRKEAAGNAVRAKCRASSDGVVGWFTLKSRHGQVHAEPGRSCYICTSSIALTDNVNIKECEVVRKCEKGEVLVVLEGPVIDEKSGVQRIRAEAQKDKSEGWVTTKGNAGSVYAEESGTQYVVSKAVPLQSVFQTDAGKEVRMLEVDEVLDITDGPREEKAEVLQRFRGRAVSDGMTGWITLNGKSLKPWTPRYRCVNQTVINDSLEVEGATTIRKLDVGEALEVLEGPKEEAEVGILRLRARAEKDGTVGWVTIAGNQGKPFLEYFPPK